MVLQRHASLRFACFAATMFAVLLIRQSAGAAPPSAESYYEKVLREKQIDPDTAGLRKYLSGLHPGEAQRARAKRLIQQLGSSDGFAKREAATAQLLVLPSLPTEALIAAAKGPDPEIRWRAKKILELGKPESEKVLFAAFKTIEQKRIGGLTAELLRAILLCDKSHLRFAARQAVKATAQPRNAITLRIALKAKSIEVRLAAAAGLGKAIGKKAAVDLYPLLDDPRDRIKLAAARAIANFGDRKCLPVLLRLLSSDETNVRSSAATALRGLSGKHFGFAAYGSPEKRSATAAKWKSWIAAEGRTVKLNFPLKPFGTHSHLGGNTLLAFGYRNKVVEYDPSGKEVWSYDKVRGAWSAEKMANGNVLIASYHQNRVFEIDPQGNIVWEFGAQYALNAKPLANGNVLIAEHGKGRAIEVSRDKKIVWQHKPRGQCSDVHRLENGNTLMASYSGAVEEVTPAGKVVWTYPIRGSYGVQPLPDGNVLIAEWSPGRVIEVTRDAKVVWEYKVSQPIDVFRLPNGNTLITNGSRFIEVTPDKKIIWSKTGCNYGTARR